MILLVHMLFGAAIGNLAKNIPAAIVLAFLSHYFLDLLPHIEYSIANLGQKQWRKKMPDILKALLDFVFGVLFILILSKNTPIIYICAFFAILPDIISLFARIISNRLLEKYHELHIETIHFLKNKKIPKALRIATQFIIIFVSVFLMKT